MTITLKPYVEALANTEKENDAELAPARAEETKAKIGLEVATNNIKMKEVTNRIMTFQRAYPLNTSSLISAVDELALLERRQQQLQDIVTQMFPAA